MLGHKHFYHGAIRKIISIFGSLFNDISIAKHGQDGSSTYIRVPLTYAPRDRFLLRINDGRSSISVKLPRICFEISALDLDTTITRNKMNVMESRCVNADGSVSMSKTHQAVPYRVTIDLYVMSRSQDECLQIVEQILPFFNPTFTVTAKDLVGKGSRTQIPITLTSVANEDTYEGDLKTSQRVVIYTLSFQTRVDFIMPIDYDIKGKLINHIELEFKDGCKPDVIGGSITSQTEPGGEITITPFDFDAQAEIDNQDNQ